MSKQKQKQKQNRKFNLYSKVPFSTSKHGFTLIEMLIAVFIFTVSLAALMSITSRGFKVARESQNQVVADYLALEGIEVVRNIRDTALLSLDETNTWQNIFNENNCLSDQISGSASACNFSLSNSISLSPCIACTVYYSKNDYAYRDNQPTLSYVDSGFTREIQFTTVPGNNDELIVTVVVTWATGQVQYTDGLFLWL